MHRVPSRLVIPLVASIAAVFLIGCSSRSASREVEAGATGAPRALPSGVTRTGEVYLYRGLVNVFSTGMDSMGSKMKARGMRVKVANHTVWRHQADDIVARARKNQLSHPLIIVGHSYGADAGVRMANYLGSQGVKVDYLVTFDLTAAASIGAGAGRVRNYYVHQADGPASYRYLRPASGFRGDLKNTNLAKDPKFKFVHHFNIETNRELQNDIVYRAYEMTSSLRR